MAYFHTNVLDEQIKALPTVDTASGSVATFDTDISDNIYKCVLDNSATTVTRCGKNLLATPYYHMTRTQNGVTFTVNADYSITITGEASATTDFNLSFNDHPIANGVYNAYLLSDTSITIYGRKRANSDGTTVSFNLNTPSELNINGNQIYFLAIRVPNGTVIPIDEPIVIYPMVLLATDTDYQYETYNGQTENVSNCKDITTLNGLNNIYADVGNIEVKYLLTVGKAIS